MLPPPSRAPRRLLRAVALVAACLLVVAPAVAYAKGGGKKEEKSPAETAFDERYSSEDAKERAEAVTALRDAPDALKVRLIDDRVLPREERADVISRAVDVLSRVRDPEAVEQLVSLSRRAKTERRLVYVEALAKVEGSAAHEALLFALGDKEPQVRGMAAYALGEHRAMDALQPLLSALDDGYWQVRAAALSAIPRLSDKSELRAKAVAPLVDFLESAGGREAVDAADALAKITGRRLGRDVPTWRRYLAGEDVGSGGAAAPAAGGSDDDEEDDDTPAASSSSPYANQSDRPHFYGMEVVSNRVVLLVDTSLSMMDPIDIDKDRLRRETSRRKEITGQKNADGGDEPVDEDHAYDIPWWRIKTRLDLAREQTILLISQMQEEQEFDIVFFSTKVEPWMGRLVPANSANKQKAIAALQAIKPDDKTNTWGAIAAAFDLMNNEKKSYEKGPDELYLVTDGAPSIGDIVDPEQILDAALQLHKAYPMRINCIGIGVNLRFMKKMCRATGGEAKFFE